MRPLLLTRDQWAWHRQYGAELLPIRLNPHETCVHRGLTGLSSPDFLQSRRSAEPGTGLSTSKNPPQLFRSMEGASFNTHKSACRTAV
jgi:hypothetical protein